MTTGEGKAGPQFIAARLKISLKLTDAQIQRAEEALGLRISKLQLAASSRLTIRKIQRIERGEGRITYLDMAAIAEQLQISLHQLLKGIA